MMATLTTFEHFGSTHKMIDQGFSRYAMQRLGTDANGYPIVVLQVWDYDNAIHEDEIHLTHNGVKSVTLTKGQGTYSEDGVTTHYAEWEYKLTLTDKAGYAVLKGSGDESVFVSWSALYGGGSQRSFQDQEGNEAKWSAWEGEGFSEQLPSAEEVARELARRLDPTIDHSLISTLRLFWQRKQNAERLMRGFVREGTASLLFQGKPPEV